MLKTKVNYRQGNVVKRKKISSYLQDSKLNSFIFPLFPEWKIESSRFPCYELKI